MIQKHFTFLYYHGSMEILFGKLTLSVGSDLQFPYFRSRSECFVKCTYYSQCYNINNMFLIKPTIILSMLKIGDVWRWKIRRRCKLDGFDRFIIIPFCIRYYHENKMVIINNCSYFMYKIDYSPLDSYNV